MSYSGHLPESLAPNIAHLLWATAARRGGALAISEPERATDYLTLVQRAAAFAVALDARGIVPGDRVGILLERGADAAAAFFGATACGASAVILNETLRARQVEHILGHASARMLVSSEEMLARLQRPLDTEARLLDTTQVDASAEYEPLSRVSGDVAQIVYTSGSTGLPKGVTISHGNLWAGMRSVVTYVGIGETDRIASLLPFSFDYGFNQLLCAVGSGAALIVERSPLPQRIAVTLRGQDVTVLPCVPPLWQQLLNTPSFTETPLPALRAMTNTGGRLPTEAVRKLRRSHPSARIFLMYGLTEAFRATYLPPDETDQRPDSIGRAIPGSEILVVRDDGSPCDAGEVGELVQRGATVTLGYWNDPAATARVFRPHPLRPAGTPEAERVVYSGDLVRRDAEGFIYYVGRRDKMIKSLGFRVSPDEVMSVLYDSGEVVEAVVSSEPDDARGEAIIAHVVLADTGSLDRLVSYCKRELPRYMQPSRVEVRESLPRLSSGKFAPVAAAPAVPVDIAVVSPAPASVAAVTP